MDKQEAKQKLIEAIDLIDTDLDSAHTFLLLTDIVNAVSWSEATYEDFLVAAIPLAVYFFDYEDMSNQFETGFQSNDWDTAKNPRTWEEYHKVKHLITDKLEKYGKGDRD